MRVAIARQHRLLAAVDDGHYPDTNLAISSKQRSAMYPSASTLLVGLRCPSHFEGNATTFYHCCGQFVPDLVRFSDLMETQIVLLSVMDTDELGDTTHLVST